MSPSAAIPFLHISDALSLILLIVALSLLRQAAVEHLRIELERLGDEALDCWHDAGAPPDEPALAALLGLARAAADRAPKIAPARLFFVDRALRGLRERGSIADPLEELDLGIARLDPRGAARKLARYRLELYLKIGVFYLLGSLSGSLILSLSLTHMAFRVLARPGPDRAERFVEFGEKLFSSLGRRALRLALAADPYASR